MSATCAGRQAAGAAEDGLQPHCSWADVGLGSDEGRAEIEDCGQHDGRSCLGGSCSTDHRTGASTGHGRASGAQAAPHRRRRPRGGAGDLAGVRVAVARAAGRSPRGPALAPRAGLHHVPGLDRLVLVAQALPSACGRAPDRGAAADRLRRPHRHRSGGRRLVRLPVQGAVAVLDPVDPGVRRHVDGDRAHHRAEDVQQVAARRADGPAGADRGHRRRCRRPAARRPAHPAPRVSGGRLRRRRRHRDPRRMRGARADRAHR